MTQVHVVGPFRLQNELIVQFLQKETGFNCAWSQSLDISSHFNEGAKTLLLWDCLNSDLNELWTELSRQLGPNAETINIALFNVQRKQKIEADALNNGVRGIFFEDDDPDLLPKGVKAIIDGELWISREYLFQCVVGRDKMTSNQLEPDSLLTVREKEVLLMIAGGGSNDEIADQLSISPHTVKTHLYNIYQKINVDNRLQAALWAAKNL